MNKKILKVILILIALLLIVYVAIFSVQSFLIKKSLFEYFNSYSIEKLVERDVIRCSYNILNTKVAYIELENNEYIGDDFGIYFYYLEDIFGIKSNNWNKTGIGATVPKNATFNELIKMAKEDCLQFQKAKGDPNDETINWRYVEADTQEEIEADAVYMIISSFDDYSDIVKEIFIEKYGDPRIMERDEILEIYNIVMKGEYDDEIMEQLRIEEEEYQKKVESGEIHVETTEEHMRRSGFTEDEIKQIFKENNKEYVGPN